MGYAEICKRDAKFSMVMQNFAKVCKIVSHPQNFVEVWKFSWFKGWLV